MRTCTIIFVSPTKASAQVDTDPLLVDSPSTQIPVIGRLWSSIRGAAHNLVLFYVNRSIAHQTNINSYMVSVLNRLTDRHGRTTAHDQPPGGRSARSAQAGTILIPMRVAIVSARYASELAGGAETLARGLAEELVRQGHGVEVWTSCAQDHFTWRNELPPGPATINGVSDPPFSHHVLAAERTCSARHSDADANNPVT